ncbi:MAG: SPOR domain-containing protein [Candidatus Mcinerneyibacterium aminivorans]|uniref:SPOR domain-containing protein n=1 Tax=Candidatus Mcinerneyibacterium aminivorans TaxID=2703815 RepID=A0A5D0MF94_9BACT|nr:MAG: SPOR domain-containing protein [Candidatus Mcinerneyibacterium aminivorans]
MNYKKLIIISILLVFVLMGCQTQNIKDKLSGKNIKDKKETKVVDEDTLDIKDVKNKKVDVKEGVVVAKAETDEKKKIDIVVNKNEEEISIEDAEDGTEQTSEEKKSKSLKRMEGYRIQIVAATQKQNAAELGEKFKEKWEEAREDEENEDSYYYREDIPIYLEFYKPYWKLRVGNYKRKKEAEEMLEYVKKIGYEDAWIVKTYILVEEKK